MPDTPPQIDLTNIVANAPYPMEAFDFVRRGLGFTAESVHGQRELAAHEEQHVSGRELCLGLRDFAIRQYGYMAPTVLASWSIRRTSDFGRIVFDLVEAGFMSKTDRDTPDEFIGVYDFAEAFSDDELAAHIAHS